MIRSVFTILFFLLLSTAFAQKKDSIIYYLNKKGSVVVKDSAAYSMVILPPDSAVDQSLYVIKGYYKDGRLKLLAYSKTNNLNLKFEGKVTAYFPNGHKMRVTNYNNGKIGGEVVEYYPNGMFYNRETYAKGNPEDAPLLLMDCSDPDGKVLAQNGNGKWIKLDGELTKVMEEGPIVNGVEEGEWHSSVPGSENVVNEYRGGKIVSRYMYDKAKRRIYVYVDKAPAFPGGGEGFGKFIGSNVKYPLAARKNKVQGKVLVTFVVESTGKVTDVKVARGIGRGCDEEAVRVLTLSPAWEPGTQNGKPVNVLYTVPISFTPNKN